MELINYTKWRNNTLIARMETDKRYLILKMGHHLISTAGLGWYVLYTLHGIRFAIENGYIPVVDWQNCKLPQYDSENVGKENVWEYFFEQPCDVNVKTAYKSNNFNVLDNIENFDYQNWLNVEKFTYFYDVDIMEWRKYFQKYVRIKDEVKAYFAQYDRKYGLDDKSSMIGILARGTDYAGLRPIGHLKPIPINDIFEQIDRQQERKKIFLATEDKSILEKFEERYPEVYSMNIQRYEHSGNNVLNNIYRNEDGYKRDINYLHSLHLISKCPIGIYAACGGSIVASLMRKDEGTYYRYLCYGHNRAKGVIVGSYLEREQRDIIMMGNKPIMFYTLNMMKLLFVEEVDIILTEEMRKKYEKLLGSGKDFGMKINYSISDDYNIIEYFVANIRSMEMSKLILIYTDYFVHGKEVVKEMVEKLNSFDGAYVWGIKNFFSDDIGRYIFDYELKDIVQRIVRIKKKPVLTDVLNEYIGRKKIFFLEYKRGVIYSKIRDIVTLEKISQIIQLLEDVQGDKIGDFESFSKLKLKSRCMSDDMEK